MKPSKCKKAQIYFTPVIMLFILTSLILCGCGKTAADSSMTKGSTYFVYIGLCDADAKKQVLSKDEALQKTEQIISDNKQGATVLPAWGGYTDTDGNFKSNDTILVIINAPDDNVNKLVEQFKSSMNLSTVYIEKHSQQYKIIGGKI